MYGEHYIWPLSPIFSFIKNYIYSFIYLITYSGSYTSGQFIWNLLNKPPDSFINFIWNDHECKTDSFNRKLNVDNWTASWLYAQETKYYVTCGHTIIMT